MRVFAVVVVVVVVVVVIVIVVVVARGEIMRLAALQRSDYDPLNEKMKKAQRPLGLVAVHQVLASA